VNIALLVGHHGKGTGASFTDKEGRERDEYVWAWMDAHTIGKELEARGHRVEVMHVDRDNPRDRAFATLFADRGGLAACNIDVRAAWAVAFGADVAIEFHYNSAEDQNAKGHEVLIDDNEPVGSPSERIATLIHDNLSLAHALHPSRGVKRARLRVTELLRRSGVPCCLLEPAFLFESILDDRRAFCGPYYKAVIDALEEWQKPVSTAAGGDPI